MTNLITIHTDGSCETQKRIGGYAAILRCGEHRREITGRSEDTTVNQMELMAVVEALRALKKQGQTVELFTDSNYVARGVQEWLPDWIARGWKTSKGKAVKNVEQWQALKGQLDVHDVTVKWIPREENTEADALAQAARKNEIVAEEANERSEETEHHLLIAGSRDATGEMLNYALRVVRRAHEKGYTILVGDNQFGIDNAVVKECRRLGAKAVVFGIANFPRNGGVGQSYVKVTSDLYQAMNGTRFAAYHARDRYMADQAQTGIFIWNGDSKGTKAGADYMKSRDKTVHLIDFSKKRKERIRQNIAAYSNK